MRSWAAPSLPRLPGRGAVPRVHDTATGALVPAGTGGQLNLYVCGITPYDATHLGHAATYIGFDTLVRVALDAGLQVRYAQNVTDVDDPLLERAERDGQDWRELAERETELFRDDMEALRVLPPEHYVGAVESIPEVLDLIAALRERGAVYDLDGDLYLSVAAAAHFGELSGLSREQMTPLFSERGGDPDRPGKKDPLDGLLWRAARPGEPSWPSPYGAGRPGWHVECAAISLTRLGPVLDVQGGGSDLAFPHHEHSAAITAVATGAWPVTRAVMHAGMVGLDGAKMSKSRGNLVLVSRLRAAGEDPAAVRLALLAHHYRADWEWTDVDLPAARDRLERWRAALARETAPPAGALLAQVREALASDLDAPAALAAVDRWAGTSGDDARAPTEAAALLDALLGIAP